MTSNKRRRHSPDQVIRKLAEGHTLLAAGRELDEVCRHFEVSQRCQVDSASVAVARWFRDDDTSPANPRARSMISSADRGAASELDVPWTQVRR